jgi:uncharacterized membrane protein YeaQ/YmgE (transglycosylase-associated protein family)
MEFATTALVTWIALGALAGVIGMVLYRGAWLPEIAMNVPLGAAGAVFFAALGRALGLYHELSSWWSLPVAIVGGLLPVAVWVAVDFQRHPRRAHRVALRLRDDDDWQYA